jgi:hypothetical protein
MMITAAPAAVNSVAAALLVLVTTLSSPPSAIPVLEVVKVYGHLASSDCYGAVAPRGSSCQLTLEHVVDTLGFTSPHQHSAISQQEFYQRIQESPFQWPLKPYGIEKSLTKTATMNKGAETRVYMDELERRGLYDKRNPTGPLPTSLRPKLNQQLGQEGVDPVVVERVFKAINGGSGGDLTVERLKEAFQGQDALDYYSFLDLIGKESIVWPE